MRSFVLSRARGTNYPGVFQEIAQLIGDEAAAKLVAQYGGVRLYIPSMPKLEHAIHQLLGDEIAQQLCGEFGGLSVEIPRACILQIVQRNKLILADRAEGMTQRQLALKYHLTERTIRKICS
ncbi:MAG: Mor transcription activator family protein [Gallionella sp.]|nr:Mor transcription activator family protein [Gallionella sp.]